MKKIRHSHRLRIGSLEALEGRTLLSQVGPVTMTVETDRQVGPAAAIARRPLPRS